MNNQTPSSTWNLLTDEQRRAILAFTREAPDDQPSGRVERAIDTLIALTTDAFDDNGQSIEHDAAVALLNLTEGLSEQVTALRLAFGLVDGATPAVEESNIAEARAADLANELRRAEQHAREVGVAKDDALSRAERAEKAIRELVEVGERATQQRDAAERALDEARAEIERLKKERGRPDFLRSAYAMRDEITRLKKELHDEQARAIEAEEPIERPCGEDGGAHDWQDGSCSKCCMDYDRRFIDEIAYDETYQRVMCALDNSSYGNGQDAVRGAVDALIAWRDNLASGHPPSTFSVRPIREQAEREGALLELHADMEGDPTK